MLLVRNNYLAHIMKSREVAVLQLSAQHIYPPDSDHPVTNFT